MLPAKAPRAPGAAVLVARPLSLVAAAVLAFAAGCGDEDDDAPADESQAATELEVTLDADGSGGEEPQVESVSCEPRVGGDPCARLDATDFAPLDPATPCTEIYGGPDEATVAGSISGQEVSATLTRGNGCEIERFDRLLPLLRELFPGYEPGASLKP